MSSIAEVPGGNVGWGAALLRGLRRCCPRCGAPGMFSGYLSVAAACRRCGLDFETIRSDDAPPYFTIAIVGHIMVAAVLITEQVAAPPDWLELSIFLPLTLAFTLALLPFVKGAVMGAIWSSKKPG
jgi:uncharacterized protein (DUF983 family)